MQKQIEIQKRNIPYTLKISNKAKHLRLAVYHGGSVVVTAPWYITIRVIEEFILHKSKWILEKIDHFISLPPPLVKRSSRIEFLKYKALAKKIARDKMNHFNQFYGFTWRRISIKNQKTRWGSCSKQGNLNFNYKIALLPERIVHYIIVHELCHLKELNHSRRFWDLVKRTVPDYLAIKKELRKNTLKMG